MMAWVLALAISTTVIVLWVVLLRPLMKASPWFDWLFDVIEPFELWVYNKSGAILWARWQQFLGIVLTLVGLFGGIDWTWAAPLTPDWMDGYLPLIPVVLMISGTIAERLRRVTTEPLAVVALPNVLPIEVAGAIANADYAKNQALDAIEKAKEVGHV